MAKGNRIRVLIAGDVHVRRAFVRRFLEDAGYEVVGDVTAAEHVLDAVRSGRPDTVILDEDLVGRGPTLDEIRRASPDVRIVVITGVTPGRGAPPEGADGYLDKRVSLSALTALLARVSVQPVAASPSGVAERSSAGSTADTERDRTLRDPSRTRIYRAAIAVGGLLVIWGLLMAITGIRAPERGTIAEPSEAEPGGIGGSEVVTELDRAYASLDAMIGALQDGNYLLAILEAQRLMQFRERAIAAGFSVSGFDAQVTARLAAVAASLPPWVVTQLAEILGPLFPFAPEPPPHSGGSTLVLGATITNAGRAGPLSLRPTRRTARAANRSGEGDGAAVSEQGGKGVGDLGRKDRGEGGRPAPWAKAHGLHR
jgi:DNA-binding NarL/FixJ family response regulator